MTPPTTIPVPTERPAPTTTVVVTAARATSVGQSFTGYLVAPDAAIATYALPGLAAAAVQIRNDGGSAIVATASCTGAVLTVLPSTSATTVPLSRPCDLSVETTATTPVPYVLTEVSA